MSVDLVILDCDGVLVDSERIAARISTLALNRLGWAVHEDEVLTRFLGCSEEHFRVEIERELGQPVPAQWHADLGEELARAFEAELTAVEGATGALDELGSAGVLMCVASNSGHAKLRQALGRVGLAGRFAGRIFSAADVARGKPAPDLFLHAAVAMGVSPGDCVVVEDSPRGVQAARAAGMRVLAYAGLTPAELLTGPDTVVFDRMAQLPGLITPLMTAGCTA